MCTRQVIDEDTLQCRVTCNDIGPSKRPSFGSNMPCDSSYCVIYDNTHPGLFQLVPDTNGNAIVTLMIGVMFIATAASALRQLCEVSDKGLETATTV